MIKDNSILCRIMPAYPKFFYFTIRYLYLSLCFLMVACIQREPLRNTDSVKRTQKPLFTKTIIKYAKRLDIEYHNTYKVVNLLNRSKETDTIQYILVQRGYARPAGYTKAQLIEIPIRSMIGMTSVQIAMADFAEAANVLTGLGNLKYVNSVTVRKNIRSGKTQQVGEEGSLNNEAIISMNPDVLIGSGQPSLDFSHYQTLINAGIPVLLNTEWLENTPLGRTEWVKLIAALLNKEALVNRKFETIEASYNRLAEIGRSTTVKPEIIVGMPFKGSWFVPDGNSFMTSYFNDAGAAYHWAAIRGTGSMGLSFEAVAPFALKADFWINCGTATSKRDIAARDLRYTYFKPYKNNTVYNFNKKTNDLGSNDYWESGVVNPHLVLADLIKILHPELLPEHQLVYYKQIL